MTQVGPARHLASGMGLVRTGFLWRSILFALLVAGSAGGALATAPVAIDEPPRIQALLEQGWAAEAGEGLGRNPMLAAMLYRQAGELGSAEGYYRAALMRMAAAPQAEPWGVAGCLLTAASQLGHQGAAEMLERATADPTREVASCNDDDGIPAALAQFDLERYLGGLPMRKQLVVGLIRRLAPIYAVDVKLALAVASVESNFNTQALSPKMAMGVMQLIPATAERFNVKKPFDPEQNIRGGLAYLRWLGRYYKGDVVRMVAAYNAGEKAVDTHRGIPPYRETTSYVARVLMFSGDGLNLLPPTGAGRR